MGFLSFLTKLDRRAGLHESRWSRARRFWWVQVVVIVFLVAFYAAVTASWAIVVAAISTIGPAFLAGFLYAERRRQRRIDPPRWMDDRGEDTQGAHGARHSDRRAHG